MDNKELRLTESFKASDSSSKIRGVVSVYDKQGNIVFSKENLIVKSGRQYFLSLAARALGYSDASNNAYASRKLGFVYLKDDSLKNETAAEDDTVESVGMNYIPGDRSGGHFSKSGDAGTFDGFTYDGNRVTSAKYAINLVGSGNGDKSALYCALKETTVPSVVVEAPNHVEALIFKDQCNVTPENFPVPTLAYLDEVPEGATDGMEIKMSLGSVNYTFTEKFTKGAKSFNTFFSDLMKGQLKDDTGATVALPSTKPAMNTGYTGTFSIKVTRTTGAGDETVTENIIAPIEIPFTIKNFAEKDIPAFSLNGNGNVIVERDSIFLDQGLNFGESTRFTLTGKEGYVDTSKEGLQTIEYKVFCANEEDPSLGENISIRRFVKVVPEKTTIYNTQQAAVYDSGATYATIQPTTADGDIKSLTITLYNLGYSFTSSVFDEIGLILTSTKCDVANKIDKVDEMLFSRLKMAQITVGSGVTYDVVYKIYF